MILLASIQLVQQSSIRSPYKSESASPENLLKMQMLWQNPRPTESETVESRMQ